MSGMGLCGGWVGGWMGGLWFGYLCWHLSLSARLVFFSSGVCWHVFFYLYGLHPPLAGFPRAGRGHLLPPQALRGVFAEAEISGPRLFEGVARGLD